MGKIQRESIWNTVISYAGVGIGYVNTVLLFPNFLLEEEVGLTRLLLSLSVLFTQFSSLGFMNMSVRYFPYFRDKANQHNGFLFLLLSVPVLGFLVTTTLFLLFKPAVIHYYQEDSSLLIDYYYFIIPLAFFTLLFNMFTAYLKSLFKTVVASFAQDFLLRLLTSVLILLYATGILTFQQFVLLYIGINAAVVLVLVLYTIWLRQLFLRPSVAVLSIIPLRQILYYGAFTFMGNISTTLVTTIDQIMISSYSLSQNGIYTTAFFMASAIMVPARSVLKIAYPQVAEFWKEKNMQGMETLYKNITLINLVIGLLLFIGIWANIDSLFTFMPPSYAAGKYVVLFLAFAHIVDLATSLNGVILVTSDKYRWDLGFNIALVFLTVFTNWYFIPIYGINGAAFASMLSYMFINLARLFFVQIKFRIQPFGWSALTVAAIATVALGVSYLLPFLGNVFLDMVVRSLLITVVYGSLTISLKVHPGINAWLLEQWQRLRK